MIVDQLCFDHAEVNRLSKLIELIVCLFADDTRLLIIQKKILM